MIVVTLLVAHGRDSSPTPACVAVCGGRMLSEILLCCYMTVTGSGHLKHTYRHTQLYNIVLLILDL